MSNRVVAGLVVGAVVVLAMVGAALGASFFELGTARTLLVVSFSALFASAVVVLLLGLPEEQSVEKTPEPQQIVPPPVTPPTYHAPPRPLPAAAAAPKANDQWWTQTGKPAVAPTQQQNETTSVPLKDFDAHRVQIAQCPRCAGFELDVWREGQAYAFECHNPHCRNRWEWLPGTAWPATVVRHNLFTAASAEGERR